MIEVTALAKYIGVEPGAPGLQAAIDAAVATVMGELGLTALRETTGNTHTTKLTLASYRVELPHGPVTALEGITIGGVTEDLNDWEFTPWAARRPATSLPLDTLIVVTYTIGWPDESELPVGVTQALMQTAASIYGRSDPTITRSREGIEITEYNPELLASSILRLAGPYAAPTG